MFKCDWATSEAAQYACKHWHYTGVMPNAQAKIGVWEDDKFIGVVLFGIGAGNSTNGKKYGLARQGEVAELVRVALREHRTPVSRIVKIAVKMMAKSNPGIRLVISFADEMGQGHLGTIYQAGNWIYSGTFEGDGGFLVHGKIMHSKTVHSRGWKQQVEWLRQNIDPHTKKMPTRKHRYLMPLDAAMRKRIAPLAKPYPKRAKQAMAGPPAQRRGSADLHAPTLEENHAASPA
jgi:hypothetical protein